MYSKGFTLIELLVVTSIATLLSSVVLVTLSDTREKALNAERNIVTREYLRAIRLSEIDNDEYPDPGDVDLMRCLGDYQDDLCGENNTVPENVDVMVALRPFLPTLPTSRPVQVDVGIFEGPVYTCHERIGNRCVDFVIFWALEGSGQSCLGGVASPYFGDTWCAIWP